MAGHANFLVCAMRVQTRCEQPQSDASPVLIYSQKRLVAGRAIQVSVMSGARAGEPASVRLEASGSASQAEEVVIQHVAHHEEPRTISPSAASAICDELFCSWIEKRISCSSQIPNQNPRSRRHLDALTDRLGPVKCMNSGQVAQSIVPADSNVIIKDGVRLVVPPSLVGLGIDFQVEGAPPLLAGYRAAGPCIRAFPEGVCFSEQVTLSIPAHGGARQVLRSLRDDPLGRHWKVLEVAAVKDGHVTIEVNHFCHFVPVWPIDHGCVPMRFDLFWREMYGEVAILISHELDCEMCSRERSLQTNPMLQQEGYWPARGYISFRFSDIDNEAVVQVGPTKA